MVQSLFKIQKRCLTAYTKVSVDQEIPTFTGMSVPERHLGVGPEALHVMYGGGSANTAHTLSGGGWSEARD